MTNFRDVLARLRAADRLEVSLVWCNRQDLLGCEAVHLVDVADALVH